MYINIKREKRRTAVKSREGGTFRYREIDIESKRDRKKWTETEREINKRETLRDKVKKEM